MSTLYKYFINALLTYCLTNVSPNYAVMDVTEGRRVHNEAGDHDYLKHLKVTLEEIEPSNSRLK